MRTIPSGSVACRLSKGGGLDEDVDAGRVPLGVRCCEGPQYLSQAQTGGPVDVAVVVGQFQQNAADPVLANDVLLGLARI